MFSRSCSSMTLAMMDSMAASSRTSCMVWLTTRSSSHCLRTVFFLQPFFFWQWHIYSSGGLLPSGSYRFRQTSAHRSSHSAAWLSAGNRPLPFSGQGLSFFGNLFLHIIEQFQRHDGRNRIRHDHIPEFQFSDITPVLSMCSTLL